MKVSNEQKYQDLVDALAIVRNQPWRVDSRGQIRTATKPTYCPLAALGNAIEGKKVYRNLGTDFTLIRPGSHNAIGRVLRAADNPVMSDNSDRLALEQALGLS